MSRNNEMELENTRSSSVVEDEEPLLPTFDRESGRKVEIGPWPLSCLLLQHLSRWVNYSGLPCWILAPSTQVHSISLLSFSVRILRKDCGDELISKWYKFSRTRWSLYPLLGYVPRPLVSHFLDGLGVWSTLPHDWLLWGERLFVRR